MDAHASGHGGAMAILAVTVDLISVFDVLFGGLVFDRVGSGDGDNERIGCDDEVTGKKTKRKENVVDGEIQREREDVCDGVHDGMEESIPVEIVGTVMLINISMFIL